MHPSFICIVGQHLASVRYFDFYTGTFKDGLAEAKKMVGCILLSCGLISSMSEGYLMLNFTLLPLEMTRPIHPTSVQHLFCRQPDPFDADMSA